MNRFLFGFIAAWLAALPAAMHAADVPRSVAELWADFDPRKDPLEIEVLKAWEQDGVACRLIRYQVGVFKGAPARVAAFYAFPKGAAKLPALLSLHGGGQSAGLDDVIADARCGYAGMSINWGGNKLNFGRSQIQYGGPQTDWGKLDATHPPQRDKVNHFAGPLTPDDYTLDAVESPRNSNWFVVLIAARRAITFLERQPEVDPGRIGVYGHSMGGKLTTDLAGIDTRVKAAVPSCGGAGDILEAQTDLPGCVKRKCTDMELACIADNAYIPRIACPVLWLSPTNDFNAPIDNMAWNWREVKDDRVRFSISPHLNHRHTDEHAVTRLLWFEEHLKGAFAMPATPRIALNLKTADGVPRVAVAPDESKPVRRVDIYYTLDPHDLTRFWRDAKAVKVGKQWTAACPVMSLDQPIFVFADVIYEMPSQYRSVAQTPGQENTDTFAISSRVLSAGPAALRASGVTATDEPDRMIDDGSRGWHDWYRLNWGHPPLWTASTRKLKDAKWRGPDAASLRFEIKSQTDNTLVVTVNCNAWGAMVPGQPAVDYTAVKELKGSADWQSVSVGLNELVATDPKITAPLANWRSVTELSISPSGETVRNGRKSKVAGRPWQGPREIRNLRWEGGETARGVELSADSFTLSFAADGRPATCRRRSDGVELLRVHDVGPGFYLKTSDSAAVRLTKLSLGADGRLTARSEDGAKTVLFRVTRGRRHVALRIEAVEGVPPERLESLCFEMNADPRLRVLDLDYMTRVDNRPSGVRAEWPAFWHRSPQDPPGGFAIYEKTDDDDEDATLLRLWVEEKLPHPKLQGAWSVARARQWIEDWQRRFADRSQLILAGRSIAELSEGVRFARRAGIKQIYLFTDTWRTDPFWPSTDLNWAVNRAVFPRGETDLREFAQFVRGQGMYLALHYVSGGIGLGDPLYIGRKPDRRLAGWGGGRLVGDVGSADTTLVFRPARGVVPPTQHRPAYPSFFEWNMLRLGDELVRIGAIEPRADDAWTLSRCRRGQGSTSAAAHPGGTEAAGVLVAYGQNVVPDNDSTLLDEVAKNYAGLLNRCLVEHVEFDGAEIHCHEGDWGYRKFATRVYETLERPTTSHDSSGRQPPAWFEYRLNSSRRLMRGSCSYSHGNYSVPVTLATPSRGATTLLDAHFTLSQGNLGGALGICKPEPMFGVTPQVLRAHGLTDQFLDALAAWKEVSARLTDAQRRRIDATFTRPQGAAARFNQHLCSPVVPVARRIDDHYEIVPMRVLTRKAADILWQHGQEHGAISPRQFIKPGDPLALENPDAAQPLQFILHVLPAFDPQSKATAAAAGAAPVEKTATDRFTGGNGAGKPDTGTVAVENVLLQPAGARAIRPDGATSARLEGDALVLTASNPDDRVQRETERLPSWDVAVDMTRRRGLGLWVTGDSSGALLLVELGSRDYVMPMDFTGRRYVEIPNGEVSWASGAWGWRMETKSADYSKVRRVRVGFGELPPRGQATAKVEQLTALGENAVALQGPSVRIGVGRLRVRGDVPSGRFLQYTGGDKAIVYDENWRQCATLPVEATDYIMPKGGASVTVSTEQAGPRPWLEVQFLTMGVPFSVGDPGGTTGSGK